MDKRKRKPRAQIVAGTGNKSNHDRLELWRRRKQYSERLKQTPPLLVYQP
ncbi:hypothetical protein GCM10011348_46230 [Marinobacterium nitratireducens]|uniref:Uncharacterized protein n=1 Tax=Marinobacterium nitratireducens TaxID=518897 RepID=A0A917ZPX3_9GAMM|nr:hypothetical protein [Marinobacterium nitratireducens]GGO89151.1 hypothetical protein GCM10011348_46230 [Marinobacterium nitratireducens]